MLKNQVKLKKLMFIQSKKDTSFNFMNILYSLLLKITLLVCIFNKK